MEYIKVSAKTVADAVIEASIQLGSSSDNIEYEVLEQGSAGFLGIGRKPAVIQARKKQTAETDFEEEIKASIKETMKPAKESTESCRQKEKQKEKSKEPVKEAKAQVKEPAKKQEPEKKEQRQARQPKEVREPREDREPKETRIPKDIQKAAVSEEPDDNAAFDFSEDEPPKTSVPKAPIDKEEAIRRAEEFLSQMLKAMEMEVTIKCSFDEEDNLNIDLDGTDMGILIGKRGQTLDAVQYLTSLAVNKGKASYVRVKVDTEDYRRRRKDTLENLARNIASKVKRTQKTVFLEPMNPYERRIIHSALQNNPYVSTHSEGEEPYRKVVVTPKRQNNNNDRSERYESRPGRYNNNRYDRRRSYNRDRYERPARAEEPQEPTESEE